ncbi:DUF4255 domain-containing protein [Marinobacter sp. ANT_B65]|uniref:DUF4255 domain-containing protein n=1 Tax=Marinobacter sp. ANT_B65 TaxID=2039467 RepID=UPI000BBF23A1|nr:DUF4255 domain-containing protein [Marinobacter sp. ANT_B65]PCM46117.1 hypothetical protein CPA50_09285 [Marinobacter sp. ANT_B65]
MSDGYAVAAVTAVIRRTLLEAFAAASLSDVVGTITVTAEPPDRVIAPNAADPTQVNIFLRQITTNPAFRNRDLPSRNSAGDLASGPPLAIDLHYFITAYGAEMFFSEILLGHIAQALHENAVLPREWITRALSPVPADPLMPPALSASGIDAQPELIKILPEPVDSEEMSRLWSAIQGQYRPTIAYRASVLLIAPRKAGGSAPPVRHARGATVVQIELHLESISVAGDTEAPVLSDSVITLAGGDFVRGGMSVEIGEVIAVPADDNISSGQITLDLASLAGTPPRAGIQPLRVRRTRLTGPAPSVDLTDVSNALAVTIRPQITASVVSISATDMVNGVPVASGDITLTLSPPVARRQVCELLLNSPLGTQRLTAPPDNGAAEGVDTVTSISFVFRRMPRGSYLLRAAVDGAESLLTVDGSGVYDGPGVTI